MPHKVTLLNDYVQDERISMNIYSNSLFNSLNIINDGGYVYNLFGPKYSQITSIIPTTFNARARVARYFDYPISLSGIKSDLCHITDHTYAHLILGLRSKKVVITVHDLIPIISWRNHISGLKYPHNPVLFKASLSFIKRADAIIAVSENTKNDVIKTFGIEPDKIHVINPGIDSVFQAFDIKKRRDCRLGFNLPDYDCYLVLISGSLAYKNHKASIEILKKVKKMSGKPVILVKAGYTDKQFLDDLEKEHLLDSFINVSCSDTYKMASLYNSVDCLLFPSLYEGFGFPPLEAMACGLPVVSSNAASLPEVIGEGGIMHDPLDIDKLAYSVLSLLENETKRYDLIQKGYLNTTRFSWNKCALDTQKLYGDLLNI